MKIELYLKIGKSVKYTVRHILASDLKLAQIAYKRLKNCKNFEKVAKEVSQIESTVEDVFAKPLSKSKLISELERVAINLKNRELSDIVETPF
jgi:parvulin-like peptidyl-prolyl isomerase